jgi:hypothetical protein
VLLVAAATDDARAEGIRGQVGLGAEVGVISALRGPENALRPGLNLEFGIGPKKLPFTFGIGAGVLFLDRTSTYVGTNIHSDGSTITIAPVNYVESLEFRRLELVFRVQPDFRYVRPFVSASAGYAAVTFSQSEGNDYHREAQLSDAFVRGLAAGVDIDPFKRFQNGKGALVITAGVRAWETGPMDLHSPDTPSGALRVISPFVALTVAGWS